MNRVPERPKLEPLGSSMPNGWADHPKRDSAIGFILAIAVPIIVIIGAYLITGGH